MPSPRNLDPRPAGEDLLRRTSLNLNIPGEWIMGMPCGADPDAWYPEAGRSDKMARSICGTCPERIQCLEWAMENDEKYGLWGGLNSDERAKLKRSRRRRRAA